MPRKPLDVDEAIEALAELTGDPQLDKIRELLGDPVRQGVIQIFRKRDDTLSYRLTDQGRAMVLAEKTAMAGDVNPNDLTSAQYVQIRARFLRGGMWAFIFNPDSARRKFEFMRIARVGINKQVRNPDGEVIESTRYTMWLEGETKPRYISPHAAQDVWMPE